MNRRLIKQTFNINGHGLVIMPLKTKIEGLGIRETLNLPLHTPFILYSRIQTLNPGQKEVFNRLPLNETVIYAQDLINEVKA